MDYNEENKSLPEEAGLPPEADMKPQTVGKRLEKKEKVTWKSVWKEYGYLVITVAVVVILFRVIFQLAYVPSGSMETTIPTHSALISWRLPYVWGNPTPERANIVTFWSDELHEILVKRVIGLPGETVSFSGGYVYIDGEKLEEPYLPAQGQTRSDKTFTVPEGCIFVMGDNRESSYDSRFLAEPYISVKKIEARALVNIAVRKSCSWRGIHIIA